MKFHTSKGFTARNQHFLMTILPAKFHQNTMNDVVMYAIVTVCNKSDLLTCEKEQYGPHLDTMSHLRVTDFSKNIYLRVEHCNALLTVVLRNINWIKKMLHLS